MDDTVTVVGGSVAALVVADALAARGRAVHLVLPGRGVGSGFLPFEIGERRFELGPRLIELAYDDEVGVAPPLAAYQPGPHGHRPYLSLILALIEGLVGDDLRPAREPELVRRGVRAIDPLLCGDLIDLPRLLDEPDLATIAAETGRAVAAEGAMGLLDPARHDELWGLAFEQASVRNHGATFHERFIEAVAGKIVRGGSSSVIAALRRKIWLPLFHPATLHDAVTGTLRYRPNRPVHTVAGGGMGVVVARLLGRALARSREVSYRSGLRAVEVEPGGVRRLRFDDGDDVAGTEVVLGGAPSEVFGALGVPCALGRLRSVIGWVDVHPDEPLEPPSSLFVADPDIAAFRVSESTADPTAGCVTLSVELRHDTELDAAPEAAVRALVETGLISAEDRASVVRCVAVEAVTAPTRENAESFASAAAAVRDRDVPVSLVGPVLGFAADSFNEQVVQGLMVAEQLS